MIAPEVMRVRRGGDLGLDVIYEGIDPKGGPMKYLVLIYSNPTSWTDPPRPEDEWGWREHLAVNADLIESGELISAHPLAAPSATKAVRVRDGIVSTTDGPYAEAKEYLAGYYLVECESVDRALEIAAQIPDARISGVEVRPVMGNEGLEM
ncbi:hypothetical protein JGU71_17145 [Antrihabitans sp. YC3-6]|uniref:YCII-related domain-containing protein n=1 Tax=Antrihabitans stalagmiti TaxID=2799499 RepID=A0A934U4K9_9NOCA|nr:YciI family protein [Antrihabitans stalagmiti]MBJ8340619.1 hypothetical protein [Antrihabitans stalagmiti]